MGISAEIGGYHHVQFDHPLFQIFWLGASDAIAAHDGISAAQISRIDRVIPKMGNVIRLHEPRGANPCLPGVTSCGFTASPKRAVFNSQKELMTNRKEIRKIRKSTGFKWFLNRNGLVLFLLGTSFQNCEGLEMVTRYETTTTVKCALGSICNPSNPSSKSKP